MRSNWICALLLAAAAQLAFAAASPNVIFILCDDLGYGDLGVTGHPYAKSPNIDRLARGGIRLENAYMPTVCGRDRSASSG